MSEYKGVFYNKDTRRVKAIQIGSEFEIRHQSFITNDPYLLVENSKNEITVENCFVNFRNEIDFKTEYSALKYIETVTVGDDINISGIPDKAKITWPDGFQEIITDGFVETTATLEGEYKFVIDHPYYFPIEVIINATP